MVLCGKTRGGSEFTPWRIWLGTCQTGDTAAPTHRRVAEGAKKKESGAGQSEEAKRTEVPRRTTPSTNGRPARAGRCAVFTNDNNNKNSRRKWSSVAPQADTQMNGGEVRSGAVISGRGIKCSHSHRNNMCSGCSSSEMITIHDCKRL